jgi:hypothetical protein
MLARISFTGLGASVPAGWAGFARPDRPDTPNVTLAEFRAIKMLVRPRTGASAAIRLVINVDLKASVPQTIISMVTKKIAGAVLANLIREAQRVAKEAARDAPGEDGYLRRVELRREFYEMVRSLVANFLSFYGEEGLEEAADMQAG